jgi:glycosyltransferase involved in cell wall biosynthesis
MLDVAGARLSLMGYSWPRIERPRALPVTGPKPRVSVVIPCYNYGRYLPSCVASVLDQPGVDVDVTIVDDLSTDGSQDAVRQLVAADGRVRAIFHEVNRGHIATYNDGLAQVDGDYVVLLSADDLLVPGSLSRAGALLEAHPSIGLAYGGAVDFSGETPPDARQDSKTWTVWPGMDWVADRCKTGRNALRSPEAIMRTSVLHSIGLYRADLPHGADLEMWMRAATVSDVGYIGGADQAYYRVHASNMHDEVFGQAEAGYVVGDLKERLACFESVLDGSRSVPNADALLANARRSLARQALAQAIRWYWCGVADDWSTKDLLAFAQETGPPGELASQWRALRRRERIGGVRSMENIRFRPAEHLYFLKKRAELRRWQRAGL